ncbi:MAG TPA: HD domain-containing phosphohydrolase [Gammaproteobacteria bacterium]|nr:HD domain-containing phosphohydrolase [Gammaproteobacteria bacterium]
MAISLVKLKVQELKPGMYVAELDRPWLDTPFLFQGFTIRSNDEIEELARHCQYVFIDVELGAPPVDRPAAAAGETTTSKVQRTTPADAPVFTAPAAVDSIKPRPGRYQDAVPMEEELVEAKQVRRHITSVVNDIMSAARAGNAIDSVALREALNSMVDSIIRNPDAMAWLTQLRERKSLIYQHAINCSVWMIIFGRSLGLDRSALENLAMVGLLFDVGKSRLPPGLVTRKPPLSPEDAAQLRRHVDYSIEILQKTPGISPQVVAGVWSHHEHFDGTGFPNGLRGTDIPVFGRMAGIVDWYQATIKPYDGRPATASIQAVEQLHQMRDKKFQAEIVDQFVQAVGVYPTGTLVELNSGEVGVVIAQNRTRRLQPKVMVIMNAARERLESFEPVDLMMQSEHRAGEELRIISSLEAGAYGIDPAELYL